MRPLPTLRLRALATIVAASLLTACVYHLDTQQGNLLDAEQVSAVQTGMTRSQVRFLLGTPMVADVFDHDRWDYIYYFRPGKGGKTRRSHVIIWFEGDKVARIEQPEPVPPPKSNGAPKDTKKS